jgi:hypothetical protein
MKQYHKPQRIKRTRQRVAWLASLLTRDWTIPIIPGAITTPLPMPVTVDYSTPPLIVRGGVGAACHTCMKDLEDKRIVRGFYCSVACAVAYNKENW